MKILFLSNGHGEDVIAARIINELKGEEISVLPIVGKGSAFEGHNVNIIGDRRAMPSGGFVYQNLAVMLKDMFSGLIGNTIGQIKLLKEMRGKFDLVVSIGDIVPIVGALMTKTRFIFIGCAKSCYYDYNYTPWEKYFLRKFCSMSFPRDKITHEQFLKWGIKSAYAGNPMMDGLEPTGETFGISQGTKVVGALPGTRDDANLNMENICNTAKEINKIADRNNEKIEFLVAAAPGADTSSFKTTPNMRIIKDSFSDVINRSDIVLGLSGTGNEQAAGLKKPVISFPGRGVQYTSAFAKRQKQLLGEALVVTGDDPLNTASVIWVLLHDEQKAGKMGQAGSERMGNPGASKAIADFIKNDNRI